MDQLDTERAERIQELKQTVIIVKSRCDKAGIGTSIFSMCLVKYKCRKMHGISEL